MQRAQITALAAFAAISLSLTLAGCGNVSTTNTCDGSAPCHAGLAVQPEVGDVVKLRFAASDRPIHGRVTVIDEQSIQLESDSGGQVVASWNQVVVWEAGESVREEFRVLEEFRRTAADAAKTNELIREASAILPGAERD